MRARTTALATLALLMLVSSIGVAQAKRNRWVVDLNTWAPAATATIHPGIQTITGGAQCTANFVFVQGTSVFIGQAAHCSSTGTSTETNGCTTRSLPEGTEVNIGGSQPGVMVYNSWVRMQRDGETDPETCAFNDLALVKVAAADVGKVNPSVPFFGGPTGLAGLPGIGGGVYSYGNSSLRPADSPLSPKFGAIVLQSENNWSANVLTVTPGIPGDSGSGYLNGSGYAIGVLSTIELLPLPATNGVGSLARELAYANSHGMGVSLALGTEPFTPLGVI